MSYPDWQFIAPTLGWCAAILFLVAYGLNSLGKIAAKSWWYQGLNAIAALGMIVATFAKDDYPPMALNVCWLLISLFAITRLLKRPLT